MSIRDRIRDRGLMMDGLYRYPRRGWVAGVCQGLGRYFGWNVKLIRVLAILGLVFTGFFPLGIIYIALWYLMDEAPDENYHRSARRDEYEYTRDRGEEPAPRAPGPTMTDVKARFARMEQRLRSMEECVSSRDFELRRELKKLET